MDTMILNDTTFVGIDAHQSEHTALAMNRFEDEKARLRFANTKEGIGQFLSWLQGITPNPEQTVIGIEGGNTTRHELLRQLLTQYEQVYEINPLYTKRRRTFGTRRDKTDPIDAKLVVEVLTRKVAELPKITTSELSWKQLVLRKTVWFHEEVTVQGARIQSHLKQLKCEHALASQPEERKALSLLLKERQASLDEITKTKKNLATSLKAFLADGGVNLTTIPGINTILAAKIVAHSNGIARFSNLDKFIKYAGIAPIQKSSGKIRRFVKNKTGNRKLNSTFYMAALCQIQWNPKTKEYYEKKIKEGKSKRQAITCVMKRTACIVYGMLKNGEDYRG